MEITRQHDETSIDELNSQPLEEFICVGKSFESGTPFFYLRSIDTWYRFSIDEEVLGWLTLSPDREDDLAEDEEYQDVLDHLQIDRGIKIESITMAKGALFICLRGDVKIKIDQEESTALNFARKIS